MRDNKPSVVDSLINKFSHSEIMTLAHAALVFKRHDVISDKDAKLLWKGDFVKFSSIRDFMMKDINGRYYSGVCFTTRGEQGTQDLMAEMEISADVFKEIEDPFETEESELGLPVKYLMHERRLRKELMTPVDGIKKIRARYALGFVEGLHPKKRYWATRY